MRLLVISKASFVIHLTPTSQHSKKHAILPCCVAVFGSKHYIQGYFQYTWWNDKCYVTVTSWSGFITRLVLHLLPILIMECVRLLLHTIIANSECLEGDGTRTEGVSCLTVRRVFRKRIIALADIGFIDNYCYKLLITAISCAAELSADLLQSIKSTHWYKI